MSTVDRPERRLLPSLVAGQRLDQPTFHARYEAMPPGTRAELVGGIVSMPSPLPLDHGLTDRNLSYWLGHYCRFTPGVMGATNTTTILSESSEPQPDNQLHLLSGLGGRTKVVEGYLVGPPELVVEIGRSSRKFDLGAKKDDYEAAGVPEYLFVGLDPFEVRWFVLLDGQYVDLPPDSDGIFRSAVFPGLWLDPMALAEGDLNKLARIVEAGIAGPDHEAFVARFDRMR